MNYKIVVLLASSFTLEAAFRPSHAFHHYLFGMFNHYQEKPKAAQECFDIVFKHDGPSYAYQGFMHHLHKTGQHAKLITFMPALKKSVTPDRDITYIFAQALEAEGHLFESATLLTELALEHPQRAEIVYNAALANIKNNNPKKALQLLDAYLENSNHQKDFIFHFVKGQVLCTLNKKHDAIICFNKAVNLNPKFEQGWLILGLTHQQIGTMDEAIAAFRQCMALSGNNALLERQIMQLQLQHQGIVGNVSSVNFEKAVKEFDAGNYARALEIVNESLKVEQRTNIRLLKLEILCRLGQVKTALEEISSYIALDPTNATWFKALDLIDKAGAARTTLQAVFEKLQQNYRSNLLVHVYAGEFYLKENLYKEAIDALHNALSIANDPELRAQCYLKLAQAYRREKNDQACGQALRSAAELKEDFPPLLNMLAYHYAMKESDLEKAADYIQKALAADAHNPDYLDTQAIIWYKQNKLQEAQQLLHDLAQKHKNHRIHSHLSKVYFKQGMVPNAIATLKISIEITPSQAKKDKYTTRLQQWNKLI